jgi:hypothetical protein
VIEGSEVCNWGGPGDNAICRQLVGSSSTAALRYPLLLTSLGWEEGPPRGRLVQPEFGHGQAIWFERAIDEDCREVISLGMLPAAPDSIDTHPLILIQTDYDPICGDKQ